MTDEAVADQEQVSTQPDQNSEQTPVPQDDKEKNFANLRETKERLEQENRQMRAYLEAVQKENEKQLQAQQKKIELEDDDDFVSKKELRGLAKEIQDLKKVQKQNENRQVPERLKQRFSDFQEVLSEANLTKLSQREPELFQTINNSSDLYNSGVAAYKSVKKLLNEDRPRSVQSIAGQGGLSDANAFSTTLSEEEKKRLSEHAFRFAGNH